ncbi:GMC family oxidoreductase N-terminal domain-containing protein [Burkholderia multivorans]|nr:GMC family oxidoreductase N-terminal domain-containing protein [Burkholderia multivorans]
MKGVDYIVVGGGTTGCVIAARLSEDKSARVVLLEEGPTDSNPYIRFPGTYYKTSQGPLLKRYRWEPTAGSGRETPDTMIQACVLGGGSSINGMVYVRGNAGDYDRWEDAGAAGWGWRDVLPYFRKAEGNVDFCDEFHGMDGPVGIGYPASVHPLTRKWLQACQQYGLRYTADFNGREQRGCGIYQIAARNALRSSSASAYIHPAKRRENLQVWTDTRVMEIIVEHGRALGVRYTRAGQTGELRADAEVIVAAGAINSPKLLMLSGIGPADQLEQLGIGVRASLSEVGRNLQDHLEMSLVYQLTGVDSYDKFKRLGWKAWAALQYLVARSGPIASNLIEGGAFTSGALDITYPDLQYFFIVGAGVEEGTDSVPGGTGCTLNFEHVQPRSRGTVSLRSSDPSAMPRIAPNYLSDPNDVERLCEGFEIGQEIMSQPAFRDCVAAQHYPGRTFSDRRELAAFLRKSARAALHPVGTCRMGRPDESVVDSTLRVWGIDCLRVADASIMPNIPSGNTNAACTMIGEKAADLILGRTSGASLVKELSMNTC